jgi:hypothetical protein
MTLPFLHPAEPMCSVLFSGICNIGHRELHLRTRQRPGADLEKKNIVVMLAYTRGSS